MDNDFFIKQLDGVINEFTIICHASKYDDLSDIKAENLSALLTKAKAAVYRIAGKNSQYYEDILSILKSNVRDGIKLRAVIGSVKALLSDLKNDYLKSLAELIHADIFSDFVEMSEYLNNEGYKDASAVIIGGALESHLKKLCTKNGIEIKTKNSEEKVFQKKLDTMNSDLAKEGIYNKLVQKQITAWLDIRNNAAHGKYSEYSTEEVKLMIQGIRHFITANPA